MPNDAPPTDPAPLSLPSGYATPADAARVDEAQAAARAAATVQDGLPSLLECVATIGPVLDEALRVPSASLPGSQYGHLVNASTAYSQLLRAVTLAVKEGVFATRHEGSPVKLSSVDPAPRFYLLSLAHTNKTDAHITWWGPDHCGYVTDLDHAGVYTAEETSSIARDADPKFPSAVPVLCSVADKLSARARRVERGYLKGLVDLGLKGVGA